MLFINHDINAKQINYLDSRAYESPTGKFYPSVNNVLGIIDKGENYRDWLMSNGYNADYKMISAMNDGSDVHKLVERFNSMPDEPVLCAEYDKDGRQTNLISKRVWQMFARYVSFYTRFKPKILAVEQVLASDTYEIGGQLDIVFELNGIRYLTDVKTGESVHDSQELQQAPYAIMWNEAFPMYKIDKIAILHLNAKTRTEGKGDAIQGIGWQLKDIGGEDEYNRLFDVFINAYKIWKWRNPNWKPLFLELPDRFCRKEIDDETV